MKETGRCANVPGYNPDDALKKGTRPLVVRFVAYVRGRKKWHIVVVATKGVALLVAVILGVLVGIAAAIGWVRPALLATVFRALGVLD